MKIIGFNLSKIAIERSQKPLEKLNINYDVKIGEIAKESIPFSKDEAYKLDFSFTINYNKGEFAKVDFNGSLIIIVDKEEARDFSKFSRDKQLPEQAKMPIFNFIMNKCNIKAIQLEDDLGLPLHIQMPRLGKQESK
ncbi:MAG: hypothetical protein ACP5OG_02020 [Candidatus Nanoarchaeia archaeon]